MTTRASTGLEATMQHMRYSLPGLLLAAAAWLAPVPALAGPRPTSW